MTCFISGPPPFLDQISFVILCISLKASSPAMLSAIAIGSYNLFTSVWIKALCKCSIMKWPDVELCNADVLIDAVKAIDG